MGASEGALVGASVVSLFVGVANVGDDVDMIDAAEGTSVGAEVGLSDCITAGVGDAVLLLALMRERLWEHRRERLWEHR